MVDATAQNAAKSLREVRQRTDLNPAEKLHMLVRTLVRSRAESPEQFRTLDRSDQALPPEIAKKHLQGRRAVLREITTLIEEGVTAGLFRPVDVRITALSIIGMCNWVAWWFHPSPAHPAEPVAEQIADNAVAMVAREAGRTPDAPTPLGAVALLQQDLDYLTRLLSADDKRGNISA